MRLHQFSSTEIILLIVSFVLILATFVFRYGTRSVNLADPFFHFFVFFVMYSVVGRTYLVRYDAQPDSLYIIGFLLVTFLLFSLCVCIGGLGLRYYGKAVSINITGSQRQVLVIASFVGFCIGYVFWYQNFSRIGDFWTVFIDHTNRMDRNNLLRLTRGNLPFNQVLYVSHIMFFFCISHSDRKSTIFNIFLSSLPVLPILIFYVSEGERSWILRHLYGMFAVIVFVRLQGSFKLTLKNAVIGVMLAGSLAVLGNLRPQIQSFIASGDVSVIFEKIDRLGSTIFVPAEFSAVNFTYNQILNDVLSDERPLSYGATYLQSIPYFFPRSVYSILGIDKEPTISDAFGIYMSEQLGSRRPLGFGMSLIGEAVANFSVFAVFILPVIVFSTLKMWFYLAYSRKPLIVLGALTSYPLFFLMNRVSFASVAVNFLQIFCIIYFLFVVGTIFQFLMLRGSRG